MTGFNDTPVGQAKEAFWKTVKLSAEYIEAALTTPSKIPLESSKLEAATKVLEIAFKPESKA